MPVCNHLGMGDPEAFPMVIHGPLILGFSGVWATFLTAYGDLDWLAKLGRAL